MTSAPWVLRAGDPSKTVFIVSASPDALAAIADRAASPSYFLVVGLANGIDILVKSINFDFVLVLANVPREEIAGIEASFPHPAPALLTDVTDTELAVVLQRHVG